MMQRAVLSTLLALALASCGDRSGDDRVATDPADADEQAVEIESADRPVSSERSAAGSASGDGRAVMIGRDGPDFDACGSYGETANLDPRGDNFLSVRVAPRRSAAERDRIGPARGVSVCESVEGWHGIVYAPGAQPDMDCRVGSPVESPRPYVGPCRSGWVSSDYVDIIAG